MFLFLSVVFLQYYYKINHTNSYTSLQNKMIFLKEVKKNEIIAAEETGSSPWSPFTAWPELESFRAVSPGSVIGTGSWVPWSLCFPLLKEPCLGRGSGEAVTDLCFFQQRLELNENYSPEVSSYKVLFFLPP